MNLYYAIIGDALHTVRKGKNKYNWKSIVFPFFSAYLSFNLMTLFAVIKFFTGYNILYNIMTVLEQILPPALSWVLILCGSSICIIYFSIFYKQKYIYIYRNYKHRKGKFFITYIIVTCLLGMLLLFIY